MRLLLGIACCLPAALLSAQTVTSAPYGSLRDGRAVEQLTLRNRSGMSVRVIGYGAIVTDIVVPDRRGRHANVALGFAGLADYEARNADYAFGAVVGRYAGRIANARFAIDGKDVRLNANDGPNALHGGGNGFDARLWTMRPFTEPGTAGVALTYTSPAGEQGFPGALTTTVTYRLLATNALRIDYEATTTAPTVLNLTNHSYFNLAGAGSGSVLEHRLHVDAGTYAATNEAGIPTGERLAVAGSPFDFTVPTPLRGGIDAPHPQMKGRRGYNHSWFLDRANGDTVRRAARLSDATSGRAMEVWTSEPALHVYTANWISGKDRGAQGRAYRAYDGVALETQHLSDAPNQPALPSTALRPGEIYRSTTIYRFTTER